MKKTLFVLIAILLPLCASAQHIPTRDEVGPDVMPHEIAPITAPFEMAQLTWPTFPDREVTVKLKRKGMQTERIQKAIDRMAAEGGGTVHIPAGVWQTGRIELKSHVNLHLDEGAELHFSGRVKDYQPVVYTRDEGIDIYSLGAFIYANRADNIALTGRGKVVGPTTDCEIYRLNSERAGNIEKVVGELPLEQRIYDGRDTIPVFLPKTFAPINCSRVLIEGVTLERGLYWNIVPQYCSEVIVRGVTVKSHGHGRTDGLDVDSSSDVLVEYCSFDCQDDCYTIKSGRGWDGLRVNRPTERVVIRNSLALRGAGGIVCGTETAGGIKNVYMHDCVFDGTDRGFRFKARRTRGGTISNIYVERVRARLNYDALYCDHLGSVKWMGELAARYPVPKVTRFTPRYHTISIHDVIIEQCRNMVVVEGMPESPLKHLFFGNVTVKCQKLGYVRDASGFSLKDIRVESADSVLTIDNAPYSSFYGVNSVTYGKPVTIRKVSNAERTRMIVLSDIGGSDPDDQQSLIHLMTMLNDVDLEGFIYQHAWVNFNKGNEVTVTEKILDAYEKVWKNLCTHCEGFPNVEILHQRIKHGQREAAMKGVGEGKDSPGSELIIQVVDRKDSRPVWITTWSGMNTLAQALWKVRNTRTTEELKQFVSKIRVYDILGQDDAGAWIVTEFPNLIYIRNKAVYGWAPDDNWIRKNVQSIGELGKEYPNRKWATEGDTPAFLYLVDNGLNSPEHPDWGSWGGRFDLKKKAGIRSMDWVVKSGLDEMKYDPYLMLGTSTEGVNAINRWKEDIYNDFAARMKWSMTPEFDAANHHPRAVIDEDLSTSIIQKTVKVGSTLKLDASSSFDPDGDTLSFQWIHYLEPSSYKGTLTFESSKKELSLTIPSDAKEGDTIHLILRVTDNGTPQLTHYRRVVVEVETTTQTSSRVRKVQEYQKSNTHNPSKSLLGATKGLSYDVHVND